MQKKATDMLSERPSKIINSELFKIVEEHIEKNEKKSKMCSSIRVQRKKGTSSSSTKNPSEFHIPLDDIGIVAVLKQTQMCQHILYRIKITLPSCKMLVLSMNNGGANSII